METSHLGLRYDASGCRIPSMGHWMRQLLVTICIALSLALGGKDPSSDFHLRTLSC
jgi:hypothetical protein